MEALVITAMKALQDAIAIRPLRITKAMKPRATQAQGPPISPMEIMTLIAPTGKHKNDCPFLVSYE